MTDRVLTPDEREAESHKYSDLAKIIVPLASGRVAVFNHKREFLFIETLGGLVLCTEFEYRPPTPPTTPGRAALDQYLQEVSLDDII